MSRLPAKSRISIRCLGALAAIVFALAGVARVSQAAPSETVAPVAVSPATGSWTDVAEAPSERPEGAGAFAAWTDAAGSAGPAGAEAAADGSVAAIVAMHAARELGAAEMDKMRGGFLLFSSVAMDVRVEFSALVNGDAVPVFVDPSVFGASGIMTRLSDGMATVVGTNAFRGVTASVQNNLSFQDLQTATVATFDLRGSMAAFRAGLFRSELNYTNASLGH